MDSQQQLPKDPIGESLDLKPIQDFTKDLVVSQDIQQNESTETNQDFDFARKNLINVIEKGTEALEEILDVASISQQPRAYEVVATLMKSISDVNKNLVELTKTKKELSDGGVKNQTINNNLFVGSTADLQRLLKKSDLNE